MGLLRVLGALLVVVLTLIGCLESEQAEPGVGGAEASALEELAARNEPVEADDHDLALCRDLNALQQRCGGGGIEVASCGQRFACSRRLWRDDVQDAVYDCLRERECDDDDAAMTCLAVAARGLDPSDAQERFERSLNEVESECGPLLEVAPGQSDQVYEGLSFCLSESDGCDATAACTEAMLEALVAEVCGRIDTI